MFDFKKWLSKNRILFLFFDFLLFHTFFLFYICASFSKPILPNIVHWPPTRVTLIAGEDTLAANEDHMNCRCFLFVHYFFFFIIILFKYSHVIFLILVMFFFFWLTSMRLCCVVMSLASSSWPCGSLASPSPVSGDIKGHASSVEVSLLCCTIKVCQCT